MQTHDSSLGKDTAYPRRYDPSVLHPIARGEARAITGIGPELPFHGVDVWNAWELTWLASGKRPVVATAAIRVPADSPSLIESKSLKLYLGSFAMTDFESPTDVRATIGKDLSDCLGADVSVDLDPPAEIASLSGACVDGEPVEIDAFEVDAGLLRADAASAVDESLHSHVLRSLCPVTAQPDLGSLEVRYAGPRIDRASLLAYIVSFREHSDFHEACVERIFVDILNRCRPEKLTVYARYQRRGGIDINPFRSNFESSPSNQRLWRQ